MKKSQFESIHSLACMGILIAMNVVLSRFLSVTAIDIKIGFSFITVVIAARMFGPVGAMIVNGIGDCIGAILFPVGAYILPLSLTAGLFGFIFGLCIHKNLNMKTIVLSVFLTQLICSLLLNSFILQIYYGLDFVTMFTTRIMQSIVMSTVQIIFMKVCLEKIVVLINRTKRAFA
ncbi:MAG: folate family ECF transporter S component [Clostridia bacterium]